MYLRVCLDLLEDLIQMKDVSTEIVWNLIPAAILGKVKIIA